MSKSSEFIDAMTMMMAAAEVEKLRKENKFLCELLRIAENAITGESPDIELPAERLKLLESTDE